MDRRDEQSDAFRRARLELIRALHRKSLLDRETTGSAAPELPLPVGMYVALAHAADSPVEVLQTLSARGLPFQ